MSKKEKIIELRESGLKYSEIADALKCSKALVSYHCKNIGLGDKRIDVTVEIAEAMNKYFKTHSAKETSLKFGVCVTSVRKYCENKATPKYTEEERKSRNTERVLSRRRKFKVKSVAYKGGKCEICGYNKCIGALDFHHVNPEEKEYGDRFKGKSQEMGRTYKRVGQMYAFMC